MKRNIYCYSLLLFAVATLFSACGEDPEIPKFNKRTISASNNKELTRISEHFSYDGVQEAFKFGLNNAIYMAGQYRKEDEPSQYTDRALYKYDVASNVWTPVWYVSDQNWPVEYEGINETHNQLEQVKAEMLANENKKAENEARKTEITVKRDELNKKLTELTDPFGADSEEFNRLSKESVDLDDEYNALEAENSRLQEAYWTLESRENELRQSVAEILQAVVSAVFDYNKYNVCSYNGKGYIYSKGANIDGKPFMLEFNPSTNKMKVLLLAAEQNIDYMFGTTEGIFAFFGSSMYKYSLDQNIWVSQGSVDEQIGYSYEMYRMFSQNSSLYRVHTADNKMVIETFDAPYCQVSATNTMDYPHDYGYDSYNNNYYGDAVPFVIDGKLYTPSGSGFYECNLSSGEVSSVILEDMNEHPVQYSLCVLGNKMYYAVQDVLYEVTF